MKHSLLRWGLYALIGLPVQFLMYLLYPIVIVLFRLKWANKHGEPIAVPTSAPKTNAEIIDKGATISWRNEVFEDNDDEHTALLHYGAWSYKPSFVAVEGLRRLTTEDGSIHRIYPPNPAANPVSRDCLATWVYSYVMFGGPKDELRKIAQHYIKYAFGLAHSNGLVSARNSSSGLNYCFDGYKKLSQPAFGPNYYGSAALLALARKELGGVWHLIYFMHFMLMGGWLWWLEPIIYNNKFLLYYDHHILSLNLSSLMHLQPSILTKLAFRRLLQVAPSKNIDGFIYATAWNSGILSEQERLKANMVVRNIAQFWPQRPPLDIGYYNGVGSEMAKWSMMGYHVKLLVNEPFRRFNK